MRIAMCSYLLLMVCGVVCAPGQTAAPERTWKPTVGHLEASVAGRSLIGIQYEHWFYGKETWRTAEATPLLGQYTTDEATVTKHFASFRDLGVDWLLMDWTNMLWMKPAWEQHTGETHQLEDKTDVLFRTALDLHRQGRYAPKLVFMLGLQNGPPVKDGVERLNGILSYLQTRYLDRPEYNDLWLYEDGKPLLTILYWPPDPCSQLPKDLSAAKLNSERWTLRWMSSQLQDNHAERCGMWSWMDGTIPQVVTDRGGHAEEMVVTPASFRLPGKGTGWTAASAVGRDHGVTYLESWAAAFRSRPRFIQIHQWNEFAGQMDGAGIPLDYWGRNGGGSPVPASSDVYADEYNVNLSDDIEPTQLDACHHRGCGGWGYYYVNLTKALISLYRGETPDSTVLALSQPEGGNTVTGSALNLQWKFLGKAPEAYAVLLDGRRVREHVTGDHTTLDLSGVPEGVHRVQLVASGVHTRFNLDPGQLAKRSATPLPVTSEITFTYMHQ